MEDSDQITNIEMELKKSMDSQRQGRGNPVVAIFIFEY